MPLILLCKYQYKRIFRCRQTILFKSFDIFQPTFTAFGLQAAGATIPDAKKIQNFSPSMSTAGSGPQRVSKLVAILVVDGPRLAQSVSRSRTTILAAKEAQTKNASPCCPIGTSTASTRSTTCPAANNCPSFASSLEEDINLCFYKYFSLK